MSKPIALLATLLALATQAGALISDGESIITRQHVDNIAEFVTTTLVEVEQTTSPVENPASVLESAGSTNQLVGQRECRRGNWANDGSKCRESCACMASQFLYGLTGSIPFKKNSKSRETYVFDAGQGVTPLWWKRSHGGKWYWSPHDTDFDDDDWSPVSTTKVKSGLLSWLQKVGLTDVAAENKFLIRMLNDFQPKEGSPSRFQANVSPGTVKAGDAKADLAMCFEKTGLTSTADKCRCKKSVCLKSVICRYFGFIKVQEAAVARRKENAEKALDLVAFGLDIAGMIEPFGFIFDLVNAGLAFARKKWVDGTFSMLGAIPGPGWAFAGIKISKNVAGPAGKLFARCSGLILQWLKKVGPFVQRLVKAAKNPKTEIDKLKLIGKGLGRLGVGVKYAVKMGKELKAVFLKTKDAIQHGGQRAVEAIKILQKKAMDVATRMLDKLDCGPGRSRWADWFFPTFELVSKTLSWLKPFEDVKFVSFIIGNLNDFQSAVDGCFSVCYPDPAARTDKNNFMEHVRDCINGNVALFVNNLASKEFNGPADLPKPPTPHEVSASVKRATDAEYDKIFEAEMCEAFASRSIDSSGTATIMVASSSDPLLGNLTSSDEHYKPFIPLTSDNLCTQDKGVCTDHAGTSCTKELGFFTKSDLCLGASHRRCCFKLEGVQLPYRDRKCTRLGGICQLKTSPCGKHFISKKCGGPSERACCPEPVSNDTDSYGGIDSSNSEDSEDTAETSNSDEDSSATQSSSATGGDSVNSADSEDSAETSNSDEDSSATQSSSATGGDSVNSEDSEDSAQTSNSDEDSSASEDSAQTSSSDEDSNAMPGDEKCDGNGGQCTEDAATKCSIRQGKWSRKHLCGGGIRRMCCFQMDQQVRAYDNPCKVKGGTCELARTCTNGNSVKGLCGGPSSRQCCVTAR